MIKCTGTKRDAQNRVLGYYLIDRTKEKKYIEKDKLKALIRAKKIQVVNLTLTSDNRLVFKKVKENIVKTDKRKRVSQKNPLRERV